MKKYKVRLSTPYIAGIDELIKKGLYVNRSEAVKDALSRLFKHYGLEALNVSASENLIPSKA